MNNKIMVVLAILFATVMSSVFTVTETERAITRRFGEIIKSDYSPGLHLKIPFVDNVTKFDARILTLNSRPERFLTSEKKNVIVDTFVKWRISNAKKFYTTVGGDVDQANLRLDQVIKDAVRSIFSRRTIKDLVDTDRKKIRSILVKNAIPLGKELGLQVVDVRVKRIDLPGEVSASVYSRMEAERSRVAREFRSQGAEAAERIQSDADKQTQVILANAYRDSEKLKGQGDATSADIYAKSFGQNKEFYKFYRSMNAYKETFKGQGNVLVMEPDSDFFKYFKSQN